MNTINLDLFYFCYSNKFNDLNDSRKEGLTELLTNINNDMHIVDYRWAAYMLATAKWETGNTFKPISEYGKGKGQKYGIPDSITKQIYYGRGYVQLTWKDNYKTMGNIFNIDLVNNPDLALDSTNAYHIMSYGMRKGIFTGIGLNKYINENGCDFINARRIINGIDQAQRIADFANDLADCLDKSKIT